MESLPPARYSIRNATVNLVKEVAGEDIKETRVAIFATLTEEQAEKLRNYGCIVEKVSEVRAPQIIVPIPIAAVPVYTPVQLLYAAGINQIREWTTPKLYGAGFNVAVVGSGIRDTHEQVGGRVVLKRNYTDEPHEDAYDHETAVAAIIVTVVPQCNILDMKVLDRNGYGTEEQVTLAIDELISMHDASHEYAPHVINLSLGAPDTGDPNSPMRAICREAIARGIFVFAAAGNTGPEAGSIASPACEQYVFAVGSVDPIVSDEKIVSFVVSEFSSRGPTREGLTKPDGVFFGRDLLVASSKSDTATIAKSGTSFSTPFASGAAVLLLEGEKYWGGIYPPVYWFVPPTMPYPMTPEKLIDQFMPLVSVKPANEPRGKDNSYGWGMPYGPLVLQKLGVKAAIDISPVVNLVSMTMILGLTGMMLSSITKAMRES